MRSSQFGETGRGSLLSRTAAQNFALPSRRGGAKFLGWRHLLNRSGDTAGERWGESARKSKFGVRRRECFQAVPKKLSNVRCTTVVMTSKRVTAGAECVHQTRRIGDTQRAVCVGGHTVPIETTYHRSSRLRSPKPLGVVLRYEAPDEPVCDYIMLEL